MYNDNNRERGTYGTSVDSKSLSVSGGADDLRSGAVRSSGRAGRSGMGADGGGGQHAAGPDEGVGGDRHAGADASRCCLIRQPREPRKNLRSSMPDIWDDKDLPSRKATIHNIDRMETYGHPYPIHSLVAELWGAFLSIHLQVEDVSAMMILLKLAREKTAGYNIDYPDNVEDVAGFANTLYAVKEARRDARNATAEQAPEREGPVGDLQLRGKQDARRPARRSRGAGGTLPSLPQVHPEDKG